MHTRKRARDGPVAPLRSLSTNAGALHRHGTSSAKATTATTTTTRTATTAVAVATGTRRPSTSSSQRSSSNNNSNNNRHSHRSSDDAQRDVCAALRAQHARLTRDVEAARDAVEAAVAAHERTVAQHHHASAAAAAAHAQRMAQLHTRLVACDARRAEMTEATAALAQHCATLQVRKEELHEAIVLERERTAQLQSECAATRSANATTAAQLQALRAQEEHLHDTAQTLQAQVQSLTQSAQSCVAAAASSTRAAMQLELSRRALYSRCEELKGAIRVYCRVKGKSRLTTTTTTGVAAAGVRGDCAALLQSPSASSTASSSSCATTTKLAVRTRNGTRVERRHTRDQDDDDDDGGGGDRDVDDGDGDDDDDVTRMFVFGDTAERTRDAAHTSDMPVMQQQQQQQHDDADDKDADDKDADKDDEGAALPGVMQTLLVRQSRANATSTGVCASVERFVFDRVYAPSATQAEVYADVEPLVHNAVDGYRVCVFAYGQTGSGKTYTMAGDSACVSSSLPPLSSSSSHGITPRALQTVFERQAALAQEGWSYVLTCFFVEIYNDVIHDLLQHPSVYTTSSQQQQQQRSSSSSSSSSSSTTHHTIVHSDDGTHISNVREVRVTNMDDFAAVYAQAVQHRRSARTLLNAQSSRSHCVFVLRIDGVNAALRQRSAGVLCLVDLAGSERVSESGAVGTHFREAVNINRSLLDLGKCIAALRANAVAPWRNSRLTYLLQGYLTAKGSKVLMLVTVSDRRAHLPESVNALRFAQRVGATVIGAAVRRVTSY